MQPDEHRRPGRLVVELGPDPGDMAAPQAEGVPGRVVGMVDDLVAQRPDTGGQPVDEAAGAGLLPVGEALLHGADVLGGESEVDGVGGAVGEGGDVLG